jgi:hypothetical protein
MNVYISCPIAVPEFILNSAINSVKSMGHFPNYWQRGSFYDKTKAVERCDVFVLILKDNLWTINSDNLTFGCKQEFYTAMRHNKKILLAYNSSMNGLGIYDTELKQKSTGTYDITGVGKTADKYLKAAIKAQGYISAIKDAFSETVNSMDLSSLDGMIIGSTLSNKVQKVHNKQVQVGEHDNLMSCKTVIIDFSEDRRLLLLLRKRR